MEELQLTLTPARVDQRNFGLMLSNWRVGTMLTALVVDRMPNGNALLSIGGRQFVAATDVPVQPGSRLQLEVQMLAPNLVLKVATGNSQVPVNQSAAGLPQGTASPLIAGQAASAAGLLRSVAGDPALRAVLGQSPELARLMMQLQATSIKSSSITASALKQAFNQSGLFNEANLNASRTGNIEQSIKTTLQLMQQVLAGDTDPMSSEKISLARQLFRESIDANLTALSQQQVKSLPSDGSVQRWFTSFPLSLDGEFYNVELSIAEEGPDNKDDEPQKTWRACIALELPSLGTLEIEVSLTANRVTVEFRSENEQARQLFNQSSDYLSQRLVFSDFRIDSLSATPLIKSTKPAPAESHGFEAQA